ncbi:MAG: hypothetical protein LBJ22_06970 [Synergistaceae bacterium]|nr:hypothetical protein [Synergistaceae bacterium]
MKFSAGFFVVLTGAIAVFALFVVNLVLAARRGRFSRKVSFALYGVASVIVLFNFFRAWGVESGYVLAAHGVVLFSIVVSLRRYLKEANEEEANEEANEVGQNDVRRDP